MLIKTRPPVSFWVCGCERFINNLHSPFRQTQERLYDTTDGLCLSYRTEKSIWPISQRDCQSFLPLFHTSDASRLSLSLSLDHSSAESRCQVHTELFIKNRGFQIGMQDERVRPAAGQVRPTRFPQGSDLLFIVSVQIDETLPCFFFFFSGDKTKLTGMGKVLQQNTILYCDFICWDVLFCFRMNSGDVQNGLFFGSRLGKIA